VYTSAVYNDLGQIIVSQNHGYAASLSNLAGTTTVVVSPEALVACGTAVISDRTIADGGKDRASLNRQYLLRLLKLCKAHNLGDH
jgi:hypothetical protein